VTVVVPAHNAARYLAQTLESILAQTHTAWQAVVVDDCSKDDTAAVASRFVRRDPARFNLISLSNNAGPAGARNAGLATVGSTELVALLDADDLWYPEYLARQLARYDAAVAEGRRIGIVACNARILTASGYSSQTWYQRTGWIDPIDYDRMLERSYIFVSAMFPRSAFDRVGGFSTECWGSEDYDLWLRLLELGYEAIATRAPLAVYRVHEESLTHDRRRMADAHLAAYERALRRNVATPSRRRAIKRELRHYRAIRQHAIMGSMLVEGRPLAACGVAVRALPVSVAAVAQRPRRWRAWLERLADPRARPRAGPHTSLSRR
jgi:glycosyltransferase involved in cell wall biosynthesis